MIFSTILTILKIIGIILLVILLVAVFLLLLVLFVPIRYQLIGYRKEGEAIPVHLHVKITWLLHLFNVLVSYEEELTYRVRIALFTLFPKKEKQKASPLKEPEQQVKKQQTKKKVEEEPAPKKEKEAAPPMKASNQKEADFKVSEEKSLKDFFIKIGKLLKNIRYTLQAIYDRIKEILKNLRYYIKILQSKRFSQAFSLCKQELLSIFRHIRPKKLAARVTIGTDDPSTTAQIYSLYGMLYPFLGEHVIVIPDFDHQIIEGNFLIKGRITVFCLLTSALKLYFNKNLKRVLQLFQKGK